MKFLNCRLEEAAINFKNKRIIFFGQGSWLQSVDYTEIMQLKQYFEYVIDNNPKDNVTLGDRKLQVFKPDKLYEEKKAIVIITSPIYMYDMYLQLKDMNLSDSIECYTFPFMQMISKKEPKEEIQYKNLKPDRIPKIIHSFWFSGEEKPESYQKCVDSWYKVLKGYEIKEWNLDNYNWHKNRFMEKAIEEKAWAFAADYARLDVLYEHGGIYLDMDVEVFKSFDDLLGNEALLSFSNNTMIDLAFIASCKGNVLIKDLMQLYEIENIPETKKDFSAYFQPSFVRDKLASSGIKMNGCLQKTQFATAFPTEFFMPQDQVLFRSFEKSENTFCVHYDNFGWSFSKDSKREKKIRDNNLLWKELTDN